MARLDASVAAATSGDVADPMWMGKVCCWLIAACSQNRDVTRAADWCRRVEAICAERDLAPLFNVCRIQYASVQVARGSWREAERELTGVLERLSGSRRTSRLEAVVQLGELRRRQGRYDEAEALFAQAEFHPSAIAGRARIHMSGGDYAVAWTAIRGLLQWLPQDSRLLRADVLYLAVVVARAAGEEEAARLLASELRETATPKLPPPPCSAQNSSGFSCSLAVTRSPAAVTSSTESRLSQASPNLRSSQPVPPRGRNLRHRWWRPCRRPRPGREVPVPGRGRSSSRRRQRAPCGRRRRPPRSSSPAGPRRAPRRSSSSRPPSGRRRGRRSRAPARGRDRSRPPRRWVRCTAR